MNDVLYKFTLFNPQYGDIDEIEVFRTAAAALAYVEGAWAGEGLISVYDSEDGVLNHLEIVKKNDPDFVLGSLRRHWLDDEDESDFALRAAEALELGPAAVAELMALNLELEA